MEVNYLGATQLLEVVLPTLLAAGCGHVSLMASVAGYRGLPKALAYGPTKAALNNPRKSSTSICTIAASACR